MVEIMQSWVKARMEDWLGLMGLEIEMKEKCYKVSEWSEQIIGRRKLSCDDRLTLGTVEDKHNRKCERKCWSYKGSESLERLDN